MILFINSLNKILSINRFTLFFFWLALSAVLVRALSSYYYNKIIWFYFSLILILSFRANSLLLFFLIFELSLIPIILIIIYWGSQPERIYSRFFLLIYTSCFSIPFIRIMLFFKKTFLVKEVLGVSFLMRVVIISPFLVKMPVLGLHFWLPKAHVEASTTGSMLLAGVLLKLGSYGLIRVLSFLITISLKYSSILWIGLRVLRSIITFTQSDLKKIIAYSRVTHITFILLGVIFLNYFSLFIFVVLSLTHGWVSIAIFIRAGLLRRAALTRISILIKRENKFHWFSLISSFFLVRNIALPPFPRFFCEVYLISIIVIVNFIYMIILVIGVFVCYYNLYIFICIYQNSEYEIKSGYLLIKRFINIYLLAFLLILTNLFLIKF